MNEPVMIHEVDQDMIDFISKNKEIFDDKIITFDDALYSQYFFMKQLLELLPNNDFYVFVSTHIVHSSGSKQSIGVKASIAHETFRETQDTRAYCTFEQLRLMDEMGVNIGLHTHTHPRYQEMNISGNLKDYANHLKVEVATSLKIYDEEQLGKTMGLSSFAFPYNYHAPLMKHLYMSKSNITKVFGKERQSIENIMILNKLQNKENLK